MARLAVAAVVISSPGLVLLAQTPQAQELGSPTALVVHPAPKGSGFERCVDVSIGDENAYGCINQRLKSEVDKVAPPIGNVAPLDARSQDIKVGVANVPAVQQQYGRNFGVSAVPYRPTIIYSAPLGRH